MAHSSGAINGQKNVGLIKGALNSVANAIDLFTSEIKKNMIYSCTEEKTKQKN